MREIYFVEESEASREMYFVCSACLKVTHWSEGGTDSMVCDHCWVGATSPNPSIRAFVARPPARTARRRARRADVDAYVVRGTPDV